MTMTDEAEMAIYGNRNLPEGAPDRPLVTFALFAFNQERFIRDAVEGAFSQTYSPLEIVLSDDCSSDQTFEIMRDMAERYEGNARLLLRKSAKNRGLWMHISDAVKASTGDFIVVAAGDDISLPSRTNVLIRTMIDEGTLVAESSCNILTEDGLIIQTNAVNDYSSHYIWKLIDADPDYFASGATACYRRDFALKAFESVNGADNLESIYNEDAVFAAMSIALDKKPSICGTKALINYRINSESLSNFKVSNHSVSSELKLLQRENLRSMSRLAWVQAFVEISKKFPRLKSRLRMQTIEGVIRLSEVEVAASNSSFVRRLTFLLEARDVSELKICVARIFGFRFLAVLRYLSSLISSFKKSA